MITTTNPTCHVIYQQIKPPESWRVIDIWRFLDKMTFNQEEDFNNYFKRRFNDRTCGYSKYTE